MLLSETTSLIKQAIPNRLHRWIYFILFWTFVSTVSATHWWFFPQGNYPYTWWQLFFGKMYVWFLWGFVSILILYLSNKFSILQPLKYSHLFVLLLSSFVVTGFFLFGYTFSIMVVINARFTMSSFIDMFNFTLSRHATFYYLAFWAIVTLESGMMLYQRFHKQKLIEAELQTKIVQLQLDILSFQLQPHFLFNTLNTISSMVVNKETESANDLIVKLSDLFRFNLEHAKHTFISLQEELRFIDIYLSLMEARFQDNLTITREVDTTYNTFQVPSMILLPLVENAVKYSAASAGEHGKIHISMKTKDTCLQVLIANNLPSKNKIKSGTGYGLSITEERLTAIYGNSALLEFESNDKSYKTIISFPLKRSMLQGEHSH